MMKGKMLYTIALVLVLVGALNWGLVALNKDYNLVEMTVGADIGMYVYFAVAAAALYVGYCNFVMMRQ